MNGLGQFEIDYRQKKKKKIIIMFKRQVKGYQTIDDESSNVDGLRQVSISWQSVSYTLKIKSGPLWRRSVHLKTILSSVSGIAKPTELLAIVGPSGAGKSSLLDVLAGRKSQSRLEGEILINGEQRNRYFKRVSGYVTQDDCLMGNLTVRETFMFHANMKMPRETPKSVKEERVAHIIDELGLRKVADELVGSQFRRGISGGEKKRVSIGCELLTDPGLLFLDEPTTGLDAYNSLSVLKTLRRLARHGRTIICTIHQPRSTIFELFDKLVVLSQGSVVYSGDANGAVPYFGKLGAHCRQYINPADFLLDVVVKNERARARALRASVNDLHEHVDAGGKHAFDNTTVLIDGGGGEFDDDDDDGEDVRDAAMSSMSERHTAESEDPTRISDQLALLDLAAHYAQSGRAADIEADIVEYNRSGMHPRFPAERNERKYATSWFVQLWHLVWRATINLVRNPMLTYVQLTQTIFFAVLVGLLYFQMEPDVDRIQDRVSALFFILTNQCFSTLGSLSVFMEERNIFNREQQSGLYMTSAYFLSKTVVELPVLLVFPTIFSSIAYWMCGFYDGAEEFFIFLAAMLIFTCVASSMFTAIGSLSPTMVVAQVLSPLVTVLLLLVAGFWQSTANIPVYFQWLSYISLFRWGFQILAYNELSDAVYQGNCPNCLDSPGCRCCSTVLVANTTEPIVAMGPGGTDAQCSTSIFPRLTNATAHNNATIACSYTQTGMCTLEVLDFANVNYIENFAILVGMLLFLRVAAYLALRFFYKEKR
jgi:ATP-binding cassette, subfamily G (WHITE), member 2